MLDVSDILQIEAIAELGSISKASERLHVSQPTLSKRLARLEHTLGVTLFHRSGSGMRPTEATLFLMGAGESLKGQVTAIQRHLELMNSLETGELKLGIGPIVEQLFFPKFLLQFASTAPQVEIELRMEPAGDLLSMLQAGILDAIVGPFTPGSVPDGLNATPIASEQLIIVARADHPLLNMEERIQLGDLHAYPLIGPEAPTSIQASSNLLDELPVPRIRCENYSTSKAMIQASDYYTCGPRSLFSQELEEGTLKKLHLEIDVNWTASFVTHPEAICTPLIREALKLFSAIGEAQA